MQDALKKSPQAADWRWYLWRACWLAAAVTLFVQAGFLRFTLPQWPLIAPDSIAYLTPAVNGGVYNIGPRTFVYPMFCRLVLAVGGDWRSLCLVQHAMGLVGPALLLVAWCFLGARIWTSRLARAVHEALGLTLPFLLLPSAVYIVYEQQALIEPLNAFVLCCLAALLCILWLPMAARRTLLTACATATVAVLTYYTNPRNGPAVPFIIVFALVAVMVGRPSLVARLRAAWPVLACAVAVYFGLGQVQTRLDPPQPLSNAFTARHLLWMHGELALNEFRRDLETEQPPAFAALLRTMIPKIEKEIVGYGTSHWRTMTFNSNALMWVPGCADTDLVAYFKDNPEGYRRFCLEYFARMVRHQPRAYFGRVWFMLKFYYAGPQDDGTFREFATDITDDFPNSAAFARSLAESARPAERARLMAAIAEMEKKVTPPVVFRPKPWYHEIVRQVHACYLPATLAGLGASLVILVRPRLRARRGPATLAWLCLASSAVLFAQVLTLAMVTVTEGRYADALRTLAVFSLVCALAALGSLLVALLGPRRDPRPVPAVAG